MAENDTGQNIVNLPIDDQFMQDIHILCQKMGTDLSTMLGHYLLELLQGEHKQVHYADIKETLRQYHEGFITSDQAMETLNIESKQLFTRWLQVYGFTGTPKPPANHAFAAFMKSRTGQV